MVAILPQLETCEKSRHERRIRLHIERIAAGARVGAGTYWDGRFRWIDSELRLRWSFPEGLGELMYDAREARGEPHPPGHWMVDRWVWQWNAWAPVLFILDGLEDGQEGPPRPVAVNSYWWLKLKQADMQAHDRYMEKKRAAAKLRQEQLRKAADEQVRAAVDSMSTKRMEQFIAVEQAIQSGETIVAHGSDQQFLERTHEAQKSGRVIPMVPRGRSLNPGMHPKLYRRQRRTQCT